MTDDDAFGSRVQALLTHALQNLTPEDFAARVDWCQQHDPHGVVMHTDADDDMLRFEWPRGRTLLIVQRDVLLSDEPFTATFIAETPDTIPDDWVGPYPDIHRRPPQGEGEER